MDRIYGALNRGAGVKAVVPVELQKVVTRISEELKSHSVPELTSKRKIKPRKK
jgi:hypothetical protein